MTSETTTAAAAPSTKKDDNPDPNLYVRINFSAMSDQQLQQLYSTMVEANGLYRMTDNSNAIVLRDWAVGFFKLIDIDENGIVTHFELPVILHAPGTTRNIFDLFQSVFGATELRQYTLSNTNYPGLPAAMARTNGVEIWMPEMKLRDHTHTFNFHGSSIHVGARNELRTFLNGTVIDDLYARSITYDNKIAGKDAVLEPHTTPYMAHFIYPNKIIFTHAFRNVARFSEVCADEYKKIFTEAKRVFSMSEDEYNNFVTERSRKLSCDAVAAHLRGRITAEKQFLDGADDLIAQARNTLATLYTRKKSAMVIVSAIENNIDEAIARYIKDLKTIEDSPAVRKVHITPMGLKVETTVIAIPPPTSGAYYDRMKADGVSEDQLEKVTRYCGPFYINIPFTSTDITFDLVPGSVPPMHRHFWEGARHPHINANGRACWGNAADGLAQLHSDAQFGFLVEFIVSYLRSVNVDDPAGKFWYLWPKEPPAVQA